MSRPNSSDGTESVRGEVQQLLGQSTAFLALDPETQGRIAENMTKVGTFLAQEPSGRRALSLEDKAPDPVDSLKGRLAKESAQAGQNFRAGALREGTESFGELVKKVDFPKFVGGLIHNVFQAVVDASIQQMQAYGELLAATAKTVDQFAADHITDAQGRDYIANRFPASVEVDTSGEDGARLKPKENAPDLDMGAQLGIDSVDVGDEEGEQKLVNAAKLDLARQRQQLLSTMVLLGINRIVVTNGQINAKVLFDMRATDSYNKRSKAQMEDAQKSHAQSSSGWLTNLVGGYDVGMSHETTVGSAVDDRSDSRAELKAQLSGDVRLSFKSETFPLERMVDVLGMQNLNQKAAPTPTRAAAPVAPVPAPAAPAGASK